MENKFNIGINIFIVREGKLLLGKRKNIFGAGQWGLPGGHLESKERFKEAAARELGEETGLTAAEFLFENIVNQTQGEKHYIQIGFSAQGVRGEPELSEPELCEEWKWFDLADLPENIFTPHKEQVRLFINKEVSKDLPDELLADF